jgi:hypothetical protein
MDLSTEILINLIFLWIIYNYLWMELKILGNIFLNISKKGEAKH